MMQTSSGPSSTGCMCFLLKWKMLSSRVMFPKVSCITPFRQLIIALEVAKNGLPSSWPLLQMVLYQVPQNPLDSRICPL